MIYFKIDDQDKYLKITHRNKDHEPKEDYRNSEHANETTQFN